MLLIILQFVIKKNLIFWVPSTWWNHLICEFVWTLIYLSANIFGFYFQIQNTIFSGKQTHKLTVFFRTLQYFYLAIAPFIVACIKLHITLFNKNDIKYLNKFVCQHIWFSIFYLFWNAGISNNPPFIKCIFFRLMLK